MSQSAKPSAALTRAGHPNLPPIRSVMAGALLGLVTVASPVSLALTGDKDRPLQIEADRAEFDENKGMSVYTGNVKLVQGSMQVTGDRMVIYLADGRPDRVLTFGQPARYRQKQDNSPDEVHASARELERLVSKDLLKMRGNAIVIQGDDRFSGEQIDYDIAHDTVRASGSGGGRVKMVLQPKSRTDPDEPAEGTADGQP